MENKFNQSDIESFIKRIDKINAQSAAKWGKMDAYQMLKHCTESELVNLGEKKIKRLFIGRIFGKMVLKSIIKEGSENKKNSKTHPSLIITGKGDVEEQKNKWISKLREYSVTDHQQLIDRAHPFFGKMSLDEWEKFIYKHTDHHLRQFGV